MLVVSTFDHSLHLELAITKLEQEGINKENILAAPLDRREEKKKIFDTIHYSDGLSLFDGALALGTVFMVLGTIYGFVWTWGPIIWGLIVLLVGTGSGLILDLFINKQKSSAKKTGDYFSEVVIIIKCSEDQAPMVKDILWDHNSLGVSIVGIKK